MIYLAVASVVAFDDRGGGAELLPRLVLLGVLTTTP